MWWAALHPWGWFVDPWINPFPQTLCPLDGPWTLFILTSGSGQRPPYRSHWFEKWPRGLPCGPLTHSLTWPNSLLRFFFFLLLLLDNLVVESLVVARESVVCSLTSYIGLCDEAHTIGPTLGFPSHVMPLSLSLSCFTEGQWMQVTVTSRWCHATTSHTHQTRFQNKKTVEPWGSVPSHERLQIVTVHFAHTNSW